MLRFVVVTFEILALIMILRSAFVQFWLSDMQTSASQWMHDISLTIENQQLNQFRDDILDQVQGFTEPQTKYLHKITNTKTELTKFNQLYCLEGDKNPFIYGTNLRYLCSEISRKEIIKELS